MNTQKLILAIKKSNLSNQEKKDIIKALKKGDAANAVALILKAVGLASSIIRLIQRE